MAQIRIDLTEPIVDGMDVKFQAPCDCGEVEGLIIYYPKEDDTIGSQVFTFTDAHGNDLTGTGNLFSKDSYVKVVVDTSNNRAYIQNADTNGYIEAKLASTLSFVKIWENASPTSSMSAGAKASVDIGEYDLFAIRAKLSTTLNGANIFMGRPGSRINMMLAATNGNVSLRTADVGSENDNTITFNAGYANGSANASAVIPLEIYGIKGVMM